MEGAQLHLKFKPKEKYFFFCQKTPLVIHWLIYNIEKQNIKFESIKEAFSYAKRGLLMIKFYLKLMRTLLNYRILGTSFLK